MKTIVLCADRMSVDYPATLGLPDEQPMRQPWLRVVHSGPQARSLVRSYAHDVELWVASSDDVSPINIAAMVKRENPACTVCLVAYEEHTGSLKSRASQAQIDHVWTRAQFLGHYRSAKKSYMSREDPLESEASSMPTRLLQPDEVVPRPDQASEAVAPQGVVTKRSKAFVLSVVSGSGGAGKSTVSVLAALLAQMKGYKTLLIDLDLQFGDVAFMLGAGQVIRLDEVISAPAKIDQLKCQSAMPALLGAPLHMEQTEDVAAGLADVLDAVSERFDVVVANTGSFWADQHIALLERSSSALFLIDQRPSSLRACKHALELCARCGVAASPFLAVANRCQKGALYTSIDVGCALQGMPAKELREGGPEVEECLSSGQIGGLIKSKNELCLSVDEMLDELLPALDDEKSIEVFADQKAQKGVLSLFRKKAH